MIRRHLCHLTGIGLLMLALATLCVGEAAAATLTVCRSGCPFTQIAPAVAAAGPGDTVSVAAGSYKGGFQITKSLSLVGAGAKRTTITGGGPVITVGSYGAASEPTVSISGVTVTGGLTHSSPPAFFVDPNAWAIGGGIYIPFAAGKAPGATLTVTDSVISGNTVAPTSSEPFGPPCPGNVPCQFAEASGGGIADQGNVTLIGTTVSGNLSSSSGGITSDAIGAGVWVAGGSTLTMRNSTVSGNLTQVSDPNGRFSEGTGVFASGNATVTISDSSISGNAANLNSSFPFDLGGGNFLEVGSHAAGLHLSDADTAVISDSHIDNNAITASDPNGQLELFDAGMCDCGQGTLSMHDSTVSGNTITGVMASNADLFADTGFSTGGAFEFDGPATVTDSQIENNRTTVTGLSGPIYGSGAVNAFDDPSAGGPELMTDSTISGNTVTATSPVSATILGGGIVVASIVELRDDIVKKNTETATAPTGAAQGGGIWVGQYPGPPFSGQLTAKDTTVTGNILSGSTSSILLQGGGLYANTTNPTTLTDTTISRNTPNNCSGATC